MEIGLFFKTLLPSLLVLMSVFGPVRGLAVLTDRGVDDRSPLRDLCILVYERPEHPISKAIRRYFPADEIGRLQISAVPRDFQECLTGPYTDVLVIAHGAQLPPNGQWALVYREGSRVSLFLNRVFQNSLDALVKAGPGSQRKRLRLANCALEEILKTYPALREMIETKVVDLDVAPLAPWPFQGDRVTKRSLTLPWLAQSSTCEGAHEWATDQNSHCRSDSWTGCDRSDPTLACFGTKF